MKRSVIINVDTVVKDELSIKCFVLGKYQRFVYHIFIYLRNPIFQLREKSCISRVMWAPVTTALRVLGLQMEDMASRSEG
jgi:hypothetical protein